MESKLATFKIDPQLWDEFKAKAIAHNSNASAVLKAFVEAYVSDRVDLSIDANQDGIEALIDARIDERLRGIDQRLGELNAA